MKRQQQKDEAWLQICFEISNLATCARRATGCVLVDKNNLVLATSYNGVPQNVSHCTDIPCAGVNFASGSGLNTCEAIHSEENALQFCADVSKIHTVYCTTSPCLDRCLRKLMNTSAVRIVFAHQYPDPQNFGKTKWESSGDGRTWVHQVMYDRVWLPHTEKNPLPEGLYYTRSLTQASDVQIKDLQSDRHYDSDLVFQQLRKPTYERRS